MRYVQRMANCGVQFCFIPYHLNARCLQVINALAKSGEPGAAARAERVLQNMVNRHRNGGSDDVKPTTINFNTVCDAGEIIQFIRST